MGTKSNPTKQGVQHAGLDHQEILLHVCSWLQLLPCFFCDPWILCCTDAPDWLRHEQMCRLVLVLSAQQSLWRPAPSHHIHPQTGQAILLQNLVDVEKKKKKKNWQKIKSNILCVVFKKKKKQSRVLKHLVFRRAPPVASKLWDHCVFEQRKPPWSNSDDKRWKSGISKNTEQELFLKICCDKLFFSFPKLIQQ